MGKHGQTTETDHVATKKSGIHKDWRAWTAVGLMLAAMAVFVLSDDESLQPGGTNGQQMPAAEADGE